MKRNFGAAKKETLTETLITRMRLGKQIDSQVTRAGDEYGDYEKFEEGRNTIKEENESGEWDQGFDKF